MAEKYSPSTGTQVDRQIAAARTALSGVGYALNGTPISAHEACLSARDDSLFNPNALGLAMHDMVEDGSVERDPDTQNVVFPVAPEAAAEY